MNKEFVPYELAVKLKELGFDEPCGNIYDNKKELRRSLLEYPIINSKNGFHESSGIITAPLYQQAFRWFRDNFGLSGWVDESFTTNNRQGVVSVKSPKGLEYIQSPKSTMFFETYEEAELACLNKLIEIAEAL